MNLTTDQLQKVEEYAALFLSLREIACLLTTDYSLIADDFHNTKSLLHQAYFRGKTKSKLELRQKVVPLAKLGSPQAQSLTEDYIKEQEQEELLDD
ncbi:MAG: hypothetical protein IH597_14970 [Bacteroidales bacterium]|nr:hypothetical protein [Bacteroidales bacterium]